MKDDLISVVVPVYNVEKYLKRCLDSILNQTYINIEIILVDDGSTDNSGNICEEYRKSDSRIKVFHKKNGGLSSARNFGIKKSNGKYITFIDSDDDIENDYVDYLYCLIKKYDTEISISPYNVIRNNKKNNIGVYYSECSMDTRECLRRLLRSEGFDVSSCAKLYLSTLFSDIEFPNGKLYEDNGTTYKLIKKCKKIAYGNEAKYNYYIRSGSITTGDFNEKKLDLLELVDLMAKEIFADFPDLEKDILKKKIEANLSIYRQIIFDNSKKKSKEKQEIKRFLLANKKMIFERKTLSLRERLGLFSLLLGDPIFKISWKTYCYITKR